MKGQENCCPGSDIDASLAGDSQHCCYSGSAIDIDGELFCGECVLAIDAINENERVHTRGIII